MCDECVTNGCGLHWGCTCIALSLPAQTAVIHVATGIKGGDGVDGNVRIGSEANVANVDVDRDLRYGIHGVVTRMGQGY